jgi:hypothetical protein
MIDRAARIPVALLGQPLAPMLDWGTGRLVARGIEITGPAPGPETRKVALSGHGWLDLRVDGTD